MLDLTCASAKFIISLASSLLNLCVLEDVQGDAEMIVMIADQDEQNFGIVHNGSTVGYTLMYCTLQSAHYIRNTA